MTLRGFQWGRGTRAAIAVGSAMLACHVLGQPAGAAALGGFDALLVDNGGPYRTRLTTMATMLIVGAAAFGIGALLPLSLWVVLPVTLAMCFGIIFARVLSQPLASSGVLILVLYFAGLGGRVHTLTGTLDSAGMVLLGGGWAVILSLVLWPVDPFRPARMAVAEVYGALAEHARELSLYTPPRSIRPNEMGHPEGDEVTLPRSIVPNEMGHPNSGFHPENLDAVFQWRRVQRVRMEAARMALAATSARAPSRTIRARNLTVLLETSDLLLARVVRLAELADVAQDNAAATARLAGLETWLSGAATAIHRALLHKPADAGASFGVEGSSRLEFLRRRREELAKTDAAEEDSLLHHVVREEREALLEIETAFDAVRAIWTGMEAARTHSSQKRDAWGTVTGEKQAWDWVWGWLPIDAGWMDALRANWTMQSAMLRHALRVTVVGAVDVVVMRVLNINHGFWLPMTSIILLQPYSAGTARKSVQRISGTIAGGVVAAVIAAGAPDSSAGQLLLIATITLLVGMTLATYAVDYAVYSFFLTPAFVLLSLPHPHDWRYAGVRIGLTLLGSAIALAAMRLLWPERAEVELGNLLRRGAAADAAYLRAMLRFWEAPAAEKRRAEREVLAPARRMCGLASNDAEEAVDRVMQEPQFGRLGESELKLRQEALTFATYLRRLTQSVTTMAVVGRDSEAMHRRLERVAAQMEGLAFGVAAVEGRESVGTAGVAEEQMLRIERQVGILEKSGEWLRG